MSKMDFLDDFVFTSVSGKIPEKSTGPYGPLVELIGTWKGHGFNQIWRPFDATASPPEVPIPPPIPANQDRFLELNETIETLEFDAIPGDIPNRGLLQPDINLHGLRYLQQIQDAHVEGTNHKPAGIHIEPGLWLTIPVTSNPGDPSTVARLANIPHGTSLVAQGSAFTVNHGPPSPFPSVSINPLTNTSPPNTLPPFPEQTLATATRFRTPPADIPDVTQAILDNPNAVLDKEIAGKKVISTTTLVISTTDLNPPTSGGGTSNIAFLQGAAGGPNAQVVRVDAVFWIETVEEPDGKKFLQLQYSQTVQLLFNNLIWPHVTVATLRKV